MLIIPTISPVKDVSDTYKLEYTSYLQSLKFFLPMYTFNAYRNAPEKQKFNLKNISEYSSWVVHEIDAINFEELLNLNSIEIEINPDIYAEIKRLKKAFFEEEGKISQNKSSLSDKINYDADKYREHNFNKLIQYYEIFEECITSAYGKNIRKISNYAHYNIILIFLLNNIMQQPEEGLCKHDTDYKEKHLDLYEKLDDEVFNIFTQYELDTIGRRDVIADLQKVRDYKMTLFKNNI